MKFNPKTTKGSQSFNVPNTPDGLPFIKLLRHFANKNDCTIMIKGRGTRKEYAKIAGKYNARCSVTKSFATWFAVYMLSNKRKNELNKQYIRAYKAEVEVRDLENKVDDLTKQIVNKKVETQDVTLFVPHGVRVTIKQGS